MVSEFLPVDTRKAIEQPPQGKTAGWLSGRAPDLEAIVRRLTSYPKALPEWLEGEEQAGEMWRVQIDFDDVVAYVVVPALGAPRPGYFFYQSQISREELYTNMTSPPDLPRRPEEAEETGVRFAEPTISPLFEIWRNTAIAFEEIRVDHEVLAGEPRIAGTRVPVSVILGMLADGYSFGEVLDEFPNVAEESVRQALLFCVRLTSID